MQIKVESVIAFLKSKGWTIAEINDDYVMAPPDYIKPSSLRLYLAHERFRGSTGYDSSMHLITKSISKLYDLDYFLLVNLFSKSIPELKAHHEVTEGVLAHAA